MKKWDVSLCVSLHFGPLKKHSGDSNYILIIATIASGFFRKVSFQRVCPFFPHK